MTTQLQEIQATLDAYKAGLAPQVGMLNPDLQKDWNLATGFQPYNLQPVSLVLAPQLSPVRNMLARVKGRGKKAEYKAVTAFNNTSLNGFVAEGSNGPIVQTTTSDVTATYKTMALADKVTFEQQWAGAGFLDSKAFAIVNLLRAMMIQEETNILFGQANGAVNPAEQAPGALGAAPNLTASQVVGSSSGGSIAAGTYYVVQTCLTGLGESLPSAASQAVTTTGSTSSIALTPVFPAGQPVLGFQFSIGAASGGPFYRVQAGNISGPAPSSGVLPGGGGTWLTNGDTITVTSIPANTQPQPPATDGSASAYSWNGVYSQMWGGSGASLINQKGALTVAGIDGLFKAMWNTARADPDHVFVNVQESIKLTNLTLGAGTPYYVVVNDQNAATGLFRVARLTNKATGSEVPVRVHPTIPQGLLLALSLKLPGWYVPTDVQSVVEMDLPQDYLEIDYPPTASNAFWQVEVRLYGSPKLYVPGLQGALYGINNS